MLVRQCCLSLASAIVLSLMLSTGARLSALDVKGYDFAEARQIADQDLSVRGSHYYTWGFWDIEIVVLYAPQAVANEQLLGGQHPLILEVHYLRDFTKDQMIEATVEGVAKALDRDVDELGGLIEPLDTLNQAYTAVSDGERLLYIYQPGVGISLVKDGESLVTVNNTELAMSVFGIWIGERPFSKRMRDDLLNL